MQRRFVTSFVAALYDAATGKKRLTSLIWGDPVHVIEERGEHSLVFARSQRGLVATGELGDTGLLEIYVIDVGQGDGVLLRTPDDRWHLVDGGIAARSQMTRKGAANFVRWKFMEDLRRHEVELASMLYTHNDFDHYGGLIDVLSGTLADGRTFPVRVHNFYHNGMPLYDDAPRLGASVDGNVAPFPVPGRGVSRKGRFLEALIDGAADFQSPARPFDGTFAELARLVATVPGNVRRLSRADGFLPGYGPGQSDVTIHILGPVLEEFAPGRRGLRSLSSESVTRNGHSLVLRLDYGAARILLTGDLNTRAQRLLLSYLPAAEFAVDVAKGCHHGSEDFDVEFLRAMQPRATVLSSGDNEDYAHPRPKAMGASARYGREARDQNNRVIPPLLYSTELARSVKLAHAEAVQVELDGAAPGERVFLELKPGDTDVKPQVFQGRFTPLEWLPLSTDLIYGLVNVRTDGRHVLCATMLERSSSFDVAIFQAGVSA